MISGPKRRLSSGYRVQKWSFSRFMLIPRTRAFVALLSLQNEGNHRSYNERRPLPLGRDYPLWRTSSGPSSTSGVIKNSSQVRHKHLPLMSCFICSSIYYLLNNFVSCPLYTQHGVQTHNSEIKIPQPGQPGTPVPCFITLCFLAYLCIQLEH